MSGSVSRRPGWSDEQRRSSKRPCCRWTTRGVTWISTKTRWSLALFFFNSWMVKPCFKSKQKWSTLPIPRWRRQTAACVSWNVSSRRRRRSWRDPTPTAGSYRETWRTLLNQLMLWIVKSAVWRASSGAVVFSALTATFKVGGYSWVWYKWGRVLKNQTKKQHCWQWYPQLKLGILIKVTYLCPEGSSHQVPLKCTERGTVHTLLPGDCLFVPWLIVFIFFLKTWRYSI